MLTQWRVWDFLRARSRRQSREEPYESAAVQDWAALEHDESREQMDEVEARKELIRYAITRLAYRFHGRSLQMVDMLVGQELPMERITRFFRVSPSAVYLAKWRILPHLKREVAKIQRELETRGNS